MSKIHSRLNLQAIEFYSKICEQDRNVRQLTLTQVAKETNLLGYILAGDRSIFIQQEGINAMRMYKCAGKVSQLWYQANTSINTKILRMV